MIAAHTDVVGSLLRPVALRKARDDWVAGRFNHAQFKSIEDRAVDEAVSLQEAAGLDIVTDGEMRRLSFQSPMTEAVDGFGAWDINAFLWGHWHGDGAILYGLELRVTETPSHPVVPRFAQRDRPQKTANHIGMCRNHRRLRRSDRRAQIFALYCGNGSKISKIAPRGLAEAADRRPP